MGAFDQFRSLPVDVTRSSPRQNWPLWRHMVGDYWTVPSIIQISELKSLRPFLVDKSRVRSIQEARRKGSKLPPIEIGVFRDGSGWIVDGNHRLIAARKSKDKFAEVIFTFV